MKSTGFLVLLLISGYALAEGPTPTESPEYTKGKETLARVTGASGAKVVEGLQDIAPEIRARYS